MNAFSSYLPFRAEHIGTTQCLVLRDYACSSQIYCREIIIELCKGRRVLRKLDVVASQCFVNQIFDGQDACVAKGFRPCRMAVQACETSSLCLHAYSEKARAMISMVWRALPKNSAFLMFSLEHIYVVGHPLRNSLDISLDILEELQIALQRRLPHPLALEFDSWNGVASFNAPKWLMQALMPKDEVPEIESGISLFNVEHGRFHVVYDCCAARHKKAEDDGQKIVLCTQFFKDDGDAAALNETHESGERVCRIAGCTPSGCTDVVSDLMREDDIDLKSLTWSVPSLGIQYEASGCPMIEALHRAAFVHETVSEDVFRMAVDEARRVLPVYMRQPILFMIHRWMPVLDDLVRLEVLAEDDEDEASPILCDILADIYRRENNHTMLLALLQRLINSCTATPHRMIRFGLEYVNVLSGSLAMYTLAVRRLESIKAQIVKYGTTDEIIVYALACHRAQYSGMAIQFLRGLMKSAQDCETVTRLGGCLIRIMLDHNEPMQLVIDVCARILAVNPRHIETLEVMAQCLGKSNHIGDAADAYQQCLDYHIQAWELAHLQAESLPSDENKQRLALYAEKAVKTAQILENIYDELDNRPLRCLVLRQHLRLEPDSIHVLWRLLKDYEFTRSFHEMIKVCRDFLARNPMLEQFDEVAIRLTLYNIYEGELNFPDEAERELECAAAINAKDPRVINAYIERCRKAGLKDEEIRYREELVDALPPNEAVEEALMLVRQYESTGAAMETIIGLLGRMNSRVPNHPLILLELRQYLRKSGQYFELASILERLARVTADLQTRKSILLEASEVHEKLGNHQVSEAMYREALLCSPIGADNTGTFMQDQIRLGRLDSSLKKSPRMLNIIPPAPSVVMTSQAVSVVEPLSSEISRADGETSDKSIVKTASPRSENEKFISDRTLSGIHGSELPSSFERPVIDENSPIEEQILDARLRGNSQILIEKLLRSIADLADDAKPPRVLQEIGCIYLYDRHDFANAREYLERASALSSEVALGEQTLNALEVVYEALKMYRELCDIYEKKIQILTIDDERHRYEIRLAQVRYERLGETDLAIRTLKSILERAPANESVLQMLAQIYMETQQLGKAIEILETITPILRKNTKHMAQHLLRLAALYVEAGRNEEAKKILRTLLGYDGCVDKMAVIEHYKRICRANDEWDEQLDVLRDELSCYLHISKEQCSIDALFRNEHAFDVYGLPEHTLREYADISYYKLQHIDEAKLIYKTLLKHKPDDPYPKSMLEEIDKL